MITQYPVVNNFLSPILQARPMGSAPLTVANLSTTVTVTINDSSNGNGFPLGPGASISWDADKALYAAASASATLAVLDNAGTIDNPAVLAQLIVASGLGTDIANQLVASSLASGIGTQTANKVAVSGAPPRDIMASVYSASPSNIGPGPFNGAVVDVSSYQSVFITVRESLPAPIAAPVPRSVRVEWYLTTNVNTSLICVDEFYVTDDSAGGGSSPDAYTTFQGPVRGPYMRIVLSPTSNNTSTVTVNVLGSFKSLPNAEYCCRSSYFGIGGAGTFTGSGSDNVIGNFLGNKAVGTYTQYPHSKGGSATVTIGASSVTVAGNIYVFDAVSPNIVYAFALFGVSSNPQYSISQITLPNRPIRVAMDSPMTGTGFRFAISYSPS